MTVEEPDLPVQGGRGIAPGGRFTINAGAPGPLRVRHAPKAGEAAFEARIVADIPYYKFAACPICLTPGPSSKEHVPQKSLGGHVRTYTCEDCNNGLGSRLEGALAHWCFDMYRHAQGAGDTVPGERRIGNVMLRTTDDGKFVLLAERPDAAIRDILNSGELNLTFPLPDANRYRLAALKHAYLAACVHLRRIPTGPYAEHIRADLIAARDAKDTSSIPRSDYAAQVPLLRSYAPPSGPPLGLAVGRPHEPPDGPWHYFVSLAGVLLVGWPLPDAVPASRGEAGSD